MRRIAGYVYPVMQPDPALFVWWCRCCPPSSRWWVLPAHEWTDHVARHVLSYHRPASRDGL